MLSNFIYSLALFLREHKRFFLKRSLLLLSLFLLSFPSFAKEKESFPFFQILRNNEVNLRTGPGERFPIEWVYRKKGLPLKVLNEFDVWRQVQDVDGTTGWMHKQGLRHKRHVMTLDKRQNILYLKPNETSLILAFIEPHVIGKEVFCKENSSYCRATFGHITGYIKRTSLFGVLKKEEVK